MMNTMPRRARARRRAVAILCSALAGLAWAPECFANYACVGQPTFLGIDEGGDVAVQLQNPSDGAQSTPIHKICNLNAQGSFHMTMPSCKAAYASLLSAKLTGKSITLYYNADGQTCMSRPAWSEALGMYFVQGPD